MSAKKIVLVLFGLVALGIVALGVAAVVLVPRFVEREVVRQAKERGVDLTPGDVSFGLGWVQVTDARLALVGVPSLSVRVGLVDVPLSGFVPQRFTLNRVEVQGRGDPATLARELEAWSRAHGSRMREPLFVKPLAFTLAPDAKSPAHVALQGAELRVEGGRADLVAKRAELLARDLGEIRAIQTSERTRLDVTLGRSTLDNPTLIVEVQSPPAADRVVQVVLSPITVGRLATLFGVDLPREDVTVSGNFSARVPENLAAGGRISGGVDVLLKGFIPPHPVELDGFVFGDTTTISTAYTLEPEILGARLERTRVKAGAFELSGEGQVRVEGAHARLALLLSGALPCNALASAVAQSRLGQALGKVTGKAALQVLSGSVGVRVSIDADSRDPARPRVLKTITPGCGLKPLSLEELVKLGELVPEALDPQVARDFEKLLRKSLPGLPPPPNVSLKLPDLGLPLPMPAPSARPSTKRAQPGDAGSARPVGSGG